MDTILYSIIGALVIATIYYRKTRDEVKLELDSLSVIFSEALIDASYFEYLERNFSSDRKYQFHHPDDLDYEKCKGDFQMEAVDAFRVLDLINLGGHKPGTPFDRIDTLARFLHRRFEKESR
ncbi:hypothetical protein [Mesorhizobium sp.]|uniref:hypothetical protein n=1 Tax=Mesorhizobium sp. TaxID=1871066 RepID=UPI000FE70A4E|nr:hypothetical protein [Mesorhizobium sp.]RWB66599.1 MAG: hypothetical protein EOQ49_28335 [Mesorhizobium sp.]RWB83308.1 MAG: hypothetical protein EOQ52_26980 [Mesorhizobium sp.]